MLRYNPYRQNYAAYISASGEKKKSAPVIAGGGDLYGLVPSHPIPAIAAKGRSTAAATGHSLCRGR